MENHSKSSLLHVLCVYCDIFLSSLWLKWPLDGSSPLSARGARRHQPLRALQTSPSWGLLQTLTPTFSPLRTDWSAGGCWQAVSLAASQEFRLFRGCDVCCCCVLLFFGPARFPTSSSHFPALVIIWSLKRPTRGDPSVREGERVKDTERSVKSCL